MGGRAGRAAGAGHRSGGASRVLRARNGSGSGARPARNSVTRRASSVEAGTGPVLARSRIQLSRVAARITVFRSNYCPIGASVRTVTDPYLLSGNDDAPVPAAPADRIDELARRMRVPRTMLEDMPPETLDRIEQSVARTEAGQETWGNLADSIARKLTAAGFRRHDPFGQRGGFHLSLWEDGVIVAWSTTSTRRTR